MIPASNINDAITHTCCLTAKGSGGQGHSGGHQLRPDCPDDLPLPPRLPGGRPDHARKGAPPAGHLLGRHPLPSPERSPPPTGSSPLSAEVALKERLVQNGDTVVITAGVPLGKSGSTNLIKAAIVNEELM